LYLPQKIDEPLPAVLYVCGHARSEKEGVSLGNKTSYQHHPAWFARHGFVSLAIDTLQLGEIEGVHHGTYRRGMWWWNSRGYTPAGVEAWNAVRSLDYLQSRPEVDGERLGVTGRSGGGAYSWWLTALDDRVKAAVPIAGITDLQNYVVDGAIEGHCDCMFMVNTYGWDFPLVAALAAPRPLLLANSDKDRIFPLDGVERLHWKLRRIYELYGAEDHLGLLITEGPHRDTQDLRVPAFRWMMRWLKDEPDALVDEPAVKYFPPEALKVFQELPTDQRNTRIHESFVPAAEEPAVPSNRQEWAELRARRLATLREKSFGGWPDDAASLAPNKAHEAEDDGVRLVAYDFTSQPGVRLRMWLLRSADAGRPERVVLSVVGEEQRQRWLGAIAAGFGEELDRIIGPGAEATPPTPPSPERFEELRRRLATDGLVLATVAPRGIGPTAWNPDEHTHIRRRFALIGQTLDGMRVWDVRRAIQLLGELPELESAARRLEAHRTMAGIVLYASLFEPGVEQLDLWSLPTTHRQGPTFLNVLKVLDMPQAVAMVPAETRVVLHETDPSAWRWPRELADNLGRDRPALELRGVEAGGGR
ncbi:MAG: alpha/beta hydrolase family protein, partial [Pirellulales bacterium]